MAQLSKYSYPGDWEWTKAEGTNAYIDRTRKMFLELKKKSDAVKPGSVEGGLVSFGVADGSAHYVVVKEKPLTLQHVPYGDAYQIPYVMIRGLRKSDILDMLKRDRGMKSIFGGA
jgi:hypothetical protein